MRLACVEVDTYGLAGKKASCCWWKGGGAERGNVL